MPYNSVSSNNLKPFTSGEDTRRQNGRKKGSKNIKTITRELLESDVDLSLPISDEFKNYLGSNGNRSYIEAITLAMIIKAINGDTRAASLIFDRSKELGVNDKESFFDKPEIVFNVVPSPHTEPEEYAKFEAWQEYKKEMRGRESVPINLE